MNFRSSSIISIFDQKITILFWSIGRWFSPAPILLFELVFEKSALRVTLKVGPVSGRHLGLKKRPKTAGDRFPEEFWRISDFHENRHFSCSPGIPIPHECSGYEEAREMPLGMNPSTISVDCFWRSSWKMNCRSSSIISFFDQKITILF